MRELCIDPEFLALIPPLSATERQGLEASILAEGCRDPLIVWEEKNILVDGHNGAQNRHKGLVILLGLAVIIKSP
jgi:hypothetical protein